MLPLQPSFREARVLAHGQIITQGPWPRHIIESPCEPFPALGSRFQMSPEGTLEVVETAVRAWNEGRGPWARCPLEKRIQALEKLQKGVTQLQEELASFLMWEIAKPLPEARQEISRSLDYLTASLEAARQLENQGGRTQTFANFVSQEQRVPLGVALCAGPFNYPFNETWALLIPLLLMGNVVIVKLPRFGCLLWDLLLELFADCFPPGTVQIVSGAGPDILLPALQTGKIQVLAFIGSSAIANQLKKAHPFPLRLKSILGLEAKNAALVLQDAPWETSIQECLKGAFAFNGQRCTALKHLFVHPEIAETWIPEFTKRADRLVCDLPWVPGVQITPLVEPRQPAFLQQLLQNTLRQGGSLASTGGLDRTQGRFFRPTVVREVPLTAPLSQVEPFGPLLPITPLNNPTLLEAFFSRSPYGMQVSLFGESPSLLSPWISFFTHQVARLNINQACQRGPDFLPFTARKDSAEGVLSISEALLSFSTSFLKVLPSSLQALLVHDRSASEKERTP